MQISESELVPVLVGRFDPLIRRGLVAILGEDRTLTVLAEEPGRGMDRLSAQPASPVVIVSKSEEQSMAQQEARRNVGMIVLEHRPPSGYGMLLIAAGVSCLPMSIAATEILRAVHLVARGGCVFCAESGEVVERDDRSSGTVLTRREIEVLELISTGSSDGEIALRLMISAETVRTHIANLRRKLRVPSRRHLVGAIIPTALTDR
jgi:two-component system, NarL family, response regulator DevR